MAKREILFNDEVYSIEESVIEASLAEMKSRLVDDYSGSGTTIVYDGTTINVDSEKLATAASNLAATLNRFAGSGASIVVNGVTYGIDSAKLGSAKENMSGTLGEMAGVVEEEDELAGTWVLNDTVNGIGLPGEQIIYNVNFASNNVTYNQIKLMEGNRLRIEDLAYNNTSVYNRTDGWVGEAYKTITITSKLSEFDDPTFIAWLQANATKQEESQIESVVGTWVFNDGGALDNLSNSTTPFDVEFMCNGKAYGSMKCDEDSGGEGMWSLYYVKTPTNIDEAYGWGIGWYDQTYRTINITSEPTDETFIAWLKANATKQEITEPEVPEEPAEDELTGTWVFTSPAFTIPYEFYTTCGQRINVHFVSNGRSFNYIEYNDTGSSSGDELYYDMRLVIEGGQTSQGAWTDEGYSTITIENNLSDVTNGDALLTWLKANATKQGATSLITFTINNSDGTIYQAEDGMTWAEFINSSYNPSSSYYPYKRFYLADTTNVNGAIYYNGNGSGYFVEYTNGVHVKGSEVINQSNYQLPQSGGAN